MFSQLLADIQMNTVSTLFRLNIQQQLPENMVNVSEPNLAQLQTNEDTIKENLNSSTLNPQASAQQAQSSGWAMTGGGSNNAGSDVRTTNAQNNSGATDESGIRVTQNNKPTKLTCANLGRNDICPECGVKAKKCPKQ